MCVKYCVCSWGEYFLSLLYLNWVIGGSDVTIRLQLKSWTKGAGEGDSEGGGCSWKRVGVGEGVVSPPHT